MSWSRRDFVRSGALLAAGAVLPRGLLVPRHSLPPFDDGEVRQLAMRALDAATGAGARHAEVRLSHYLRWEIQESGGSDGGGITGTVETNVNGTRLDTLAIGVRALVGGAWGFASSTIWSADEAARLGVSAVGQARTTARAGMPPVELVPAPVVKDGRWAMPVERDPFSVSREEILDTITGTAYTTLRGWGTPLITVILSRLESAFASTDGSFCSQVRYGTEARTWVSLRHEFRDGQFAGRRGYAMGWPLPLAGRGWEYLGRARWHEIIERTLAEQEEYLALPLKPVEVGRYDVLFDQSSTARLLSGTIGAATELDRAMGYEANAGGTSYLNDPAAMVGKEPIGAPGLTVTANRSLAGGMATVRWDDEGVEPEEFPLVRDGVLADFLTTRDSALWLRDSYARLSRPVRSHGCAGGATALDATQLQRPNLRLAPGTERADFRELIARMGTGVAVEEAITDMDFNALNGMALLDQDFSATRFVEVKNGRKVARLTPQGTAVLFRAPELWKSVLAFGGPESVRPIPVKMQKGEPAQETWHTVEAPPMLVRQMAVIDPTR